jgi:hypothetical protein
VSWLLVDLGRLTHRPMRYPRVGHRRPGADGPHHRGASGAGRTSSTSEPAGARQRKPQRAPRACLPLSHVGAASDYRSPHHTVASTGTLLDSLLSKPSRLEEGMPAMTASDGLHVVVGAGGASGRLVVQHLAGCPSRLCRRHLDVRPGAWAHDRGHAVPTGERQGDAAGVARRADPPGRRCRSVAGQHRSRRRAVRSRRPVHDRRQRLLGRRPADVRCGAVARRP